jgi:hypothetical protein
MAVSRFVTTLLAQTCGGPSYRTNQVFHSGVVPSQYTLALPRIPRLVALNPAHQLRPRAPRPVRPLTDAGVERTQWRSGRQLLPVKPSWSQKLLILARATLPRGSGAAIPGCYRAHKFSYPLGVAGEIGRGRCNEGQTGSRPSSPRPAARPRNDPATSKWVPACREYTGGSG